MAHHFILLQLNSSNPVPLWQLGGTPNHLFHKRILTKWLNGGVFVYELSGCRFESSCSHLNFRFCTCFEQGVPWHSGNYRKWIHSETRSWHDKNIQSFFLIFFMKTCFRLVLIHVRFVLICVDSSWTRNDSCCYVSDLHWLVLIRVELMLTRVKLVLNRLGTRLLE